MGCGSTRTGRRSARVRRRSGLVLGEGERRNHYQEHKQYLRPQGTSIDHEIHRILLNFKFHPSAKAQTCKPAERGIVSIVVLGPGRRPPETAAARPECRLGPAAQQRYQKPGCRRNRFSGIRGVLTMC
ncbi:hypothetical protein SBA2_570012 [Acidobacteriia bacterium SbA2]|nr:hypothetical protein SBA2_570012 [Acidobacteriia bacterium SbA2]